MLKPKFKLPQCEQCDNRNHSIFCVLEEAEVSEVSLNKGASQYKKGERIFLEGNRPQSLFCINSGKVKVYKSGGAGKEQITRLAGPGDVIGYRAMISGENYSASAAALEDAVICEIPKPVFSDILKRSPELAMKLVNLLARDLRTAEQQMTALAQKPVRERLAEVLLSIKEAFGLEADGKTLAVTLSREDLGNMVGTATETLIRLLGELKLEKLIGLEGKKILLLNIPKLVQTANVFD